MSELRCCPFCGGEAEFVKMGIAKDIPLGFVRCTECGIRLRQENCTEGFARNEWNRRILVDNITKKLEEKRMDISGNTSLHYLYSEGYIDALDYVSDIVKQEINNGLE